MVDIEDVYEVFGEDAKLEQLKSSSPIVLGGLEFQVIQHDDINIYDTDDDKFQKILDFVNEEPINEYIVEVKEPENEFIVENKELEELDEYLKTL